MKQILLKTWLVMLMMCVGVGAWADEVTLGNWTSKPISGSNSTSVNGTLTDSGSNSWSVSLTGSDKTKNPSQSVFTGTTYWQLGASGNMTTAVFSTSAIPGTITKIVVNCAAYSGKGTANVTVGGSAFGTQGQTMPSWSNNTGGDITFTGSASGEIKVTLAPSTGGRAIYLSSITVTYAAGDPKKVTYSDGGSDTETSVGAGVTLPTRENVGDYTFRGWSTTNIASETTTTPTILTGTYKPNQDITLYPVYSRVDGEDGTPSVNISEYATANSWQGSGAVAYKSITLDDNITVTTTGTGNNGKYYSDWRLYQSGNGNAIVTAKNGALLKSATFTFTVSNTGALLYDGNAVTSGTAVQLNGTSATFTVGNSGSATNGQVRITEIAVEYAIGTTYYISVPPIPTPTFASLDELIDANLEEPTVVNVTLTDAEVTMAMTHPMLPGMYIVVLNHMATIGAPGSDLGWTQGGTVSGTLENVTWDPEENTLTSEDGVSFWSSLEYTAPAGGATETITLNPACHDEDGLVYTTYSSANAFYAPAEDLIIYEVMVDGGEIALEPYEPYDLVPAYTGVLVCAMEGGDYEVEIETDPEYLDLAESVLGEDNALRPTCFEDGITADDMAAEDPGCEFFRLTMHNGRKIGFWWGAEDGAAFDIAANKAYLAVDKGNLGLGAGVKESLWFGDKATSIKNIANGKQNKVVFNLNGQRVSKTQKGLYITNGKKYMVK